MPNVYFVVTTASAPEACSVSATISGGTVDRIDALRYRYAFLSFVTSPAMTGMISSSHTYSTLLTTTFEGGNASRITTEPPGFVTRYISSTPRRRSGKLRSVYTVVTASKVPSACFNAQTSPCVNSAPGTTRRASSNITSFYSHPGFGAVLVHPDGHDTTVEPLADAVETYWLFAEVWGALTKPGLSFATAPARALGLLRTLLHKKDAYFDYHDPLPFLAHFCVHLPTLLLRNMRNGNRWAKIDPCIGKMTEENGD